MTFILNYFHFLFVNVFFITTFVLSIKAILKYVIMNYNGTSHKAQDEKDYIRRQISDGELSYDRSYPGGAYWSSDDTCHYNRNGELLRDISEYNEDSEDGYSPMGDE